MKMELDENDKHRRTSQIPLILAIEDNEDNLLIVNYIVDSLNYRFIGEADGNKTLLIAREFQPNLILLDIMLPEANGIDIFHVLRQDSSTKHIPIIAVTALASAEEKQKILDAGFDAYVSKPYMLEDIEEVICRYLN
ncbi:MAG: response regulator [Richelia sp. RM2_1_2]|nr:response regulator [Richelia sp. SM2_1_7]NJM17848.1 response regulator [Richelia sp. SM1_7_0]NJN09512.1 response regulator [Richelia sp. RM1_1_1]NJO27231.1 response regulator [Richelia sp. SL_2_1]NJO59568.1 response regulator [Richelia sp. RM2_1_2]NJS16742.1 response regulator [Nostocaceae cyanobacterium CSU_2_110]